MSIFGWIIIGAVAGWIASMIMGTNDRQGCLADVLIGVAGAVVGGFLFSLISGGEWATQFNIMSLIVAVIGACLVIAIKKVVAGKR